MLIPQSCRAGEILMLATLSKEQFKKVLVVALAKDESTRRTTENRIASINPARRLCSCLLYAWILSRKCLLYYYYIETNIFDLKNNKLVWSATTKSLDVSDVKTPQLMKSWKLAYSK